MSLFRVFVPLLCFICAGCRVGSTGQTDDQKEPYFLAGKNRLQERDYPGAIDMFEKALDVNPRSASAHFELGVLYEQQQNDYTAALYHYQRTVMLNSNMPFAELARQRMQECKRELAKSVVQPISLESMQRELDSLRAENVQLKQQLRQWQAYYAGDAATPSNFVHVPTNLPVRSTQTIVYARNDSTTVSTQSHATSRASPSIISNRTHTIVSGDTLTAIARHYNIKLSALQTANPSMDARRIRPGQVLIIPPP